MEAVVQLSKKRSNTDDYQNRLRATHEEYKNTFFLSRQMNETRNEKEILQRLGNILEERIHYSALALHLKEKFGSDFYFLNGQNLNEKLKKQIRQLQRSGYFEWVCKFGRCSIVAGENSKDPNHSTVLVPLLSGKQEIGVLVIVLNLHSHELTTRESDLLSLLGTQAAQAIENSYHYQEMSLKNHAISNIKIFLENSLESMSDGFFAIDRENKISLFNSAAGNILGVSVSKAIGCEIHQLFTSEFVKFFDHALEVTNMTGNYEDELNYQNPVSQKTFPVSVRLSILKNELGRPIGVITVCQDISEQKELIHLRRLEQLKHEFISSISHELRTPLSIIKSFAEILINPDKDLSAQKKFLEIIVKEANHLTGIIDDVIDLSSLSQYEIIPDLESVNILQAFEIAIESIGTLINSKNIKIVKKLDADCYMVKANFNRLVQVFVNLLKNSINFSPEGGAIEVWSESLKGRRTLDKNNYLKVSVTDYGIGIPKKYQKIIFEKFKQICPDPATKPEGNGLGLSICKTIIEKLNGNIWVESVEKKGSTFYFTIPMVKTDLEEL